MREFATNHGDHMPTSVSRDVSALRANPQPPHPPPPDPYTCVHEEILQNIARHKYKRDSCDTITSTL